MNWYKKARYGGAELERSIWYHGTRSRNLPKILAEGLVPFPKQRSWQNDPSANFNSPSLASLGGIYLTQNLMTARSAALKDKNKNEDMIIVAIEAQPRSFLMDEDDISGIVKSAIKSDKYLTNEWLVAELYMAKQLNSNDSYVQQTQDNYIQKSLEEIKRKFTIQNALDEKITNALKYGWDISLNRQAAYIDKETWKKAFYRNLSEDMNKKLNDKYGEIKKQYENIEIINEKYDEYINSLVLQQPNPQISESQYAQFVDKLTRLLKAFSRPIKQKETWNSIARTEENIGYSGSNKIICIISENNKYETKLIYGTIPEKLKEDWQKHVSNSGLNPKI